MGGLMSVQSGVFWGSPGMRGAKRWCHLCAWEHTKYYRQEAREGEKRKVGKVNEQKGKVKGKIKIRTRFETKSKAFAFAFVPYLALLQSKVHLVVSRFHASSTPNPNSTDSCGVSCTPTSSTPLRLGLTLWAHRRYLNRADPTICIFIPGSIIKYPRFIATIYCQRW